MPTGAATRFQESFFESNPSLRSPLDLMRHTLDACFYVKDRDSRYVMCNRYHLRTYDLTEESGLVGKAARDFFPDLLAQAYESNDRRVFDSGQPLSNEVWLVPHIRGTPRWFVSNKSPLLATDGETVIGLIGLMHPIDTPEDQQTHFRELQRVIEFLAGNFVSDISVDSLAEIAGISVPHLNRRFRHLLRLSPMEYVHSLRIQEAQRLLITTDQPVGDIAVATGFYDQSHFTKRFRKSTGITPLRYRKRYR